MGSLVKAGGGGTGAIGGDRVVLGCGVVYVRACVIGVWVRRLGSVR